MPKKKPAKKMLVAKPTATKPAAKSAASEAAPSKTAFVLSQPSGLRAKEIVAAARRLGLELSEGHVYTIRSAAKQKGTNAGGAGGGGRAAKAVTAKVAKAAPAKAAPAKAARAKAARAKAAPAKAAAAKAAVARGATSAKGAAKAAKRGRPAKAVKTTVPAAPKALPAAVADLAALDLTYAVGRLVESGKTTVAEVLTLAEERVARMSSLESDLAALRGGQVPAIAPPSQEAVAKGRAVKAKTTRPKQAVAKGAAKSGTVSTRSDGRTFTTTAKVVAARKLQGRYMGYLRQLPEAQKDLFKAIAKKDGVPAAIAALMKKLGKA